ncbi:NAD(+) diphosphatase [Desulfoferula mesophila]|uniref:NAD(+) diphosphatase n=1 Tax=Desulfoferula mesophila TaxID=3058419 RepID=A0AAU9EIY4_9BACT|nr:NADH pyrophosphatase [Desulfoferula mesophilus]
MSDEFIAGFNPPPDDGGPAWWLIYHEDKFLVQDEDPPRLPLARQVWELGLTLETARYLGQWQGRPAYAATLGHPAATPEGYAWHGLYGLAMGWPEGLTALGGRAKQILAWERRNRFCGVCASPMIDDPKERARRCPRCGLVAYPRVSPAVIMAVQREGKVLLGRSPRFAPGRMSVLAGFVEPGETLEQTVAREIKEEVGIAVTDIRYFASQPWPFPDSLMVGFTCQWVAGEIEVDGEEIVEAGWYGLEDLPRIPPRSTIARRLIDHVVVGAQHLGSTGWR